MTLIRTSLIQEGPPINLKFTGPETVASHAYTLFGNSPKEHFAVFVLNTQNKLIHAEIVSIGTANASLVHPREVFHAAILAYGTSIITAHNHPSNDKEPSPQDILTFARLDKAGELLGIPVLDHIIITHDQHYYSHTHEQTHKLDTTPTLNNDNNKQTANTQLLATTANRT